MKSRFFHNCKTRLYEFFFLHWRYGLSWSTTQSLVFCHATSPRWTHPPTMCDLIIEQTLYCLKILVTIPLCNLIPCLFQLNFVFFTGIYFSLVLFQAFHFLRTARVFSCEMCEIFKNTFSSRTLPVAAPVYTSLFTLTCLCLFTLYLSILKFSLYYYMNLIKLVKYVEYRNYDDIFYIEEYF